MVLLALTRGMRSHRHLTDDCGTGEIVARCAIYTVRYHWTVWCCLRWGVRALFLQGFKAPLRRWKWSLPPRAPMLDGQGIYI